MVDSSADTCVECTNNKSPISSVKVLGYTTKCTTPRWVCIIIILVALPSTSLAAKSPHPLSQYPDHHVSGGALQMNIRNEELCKMQCAQTNWCAALDFDYNTLTCWFHSVKTVCNGLRVLQRSNHYKYITCSRSVPRKITSTRVLAISTLQNVAEQYRNTHSIGGTRVSGSVTWIDCVAACQGNCHAVDFDTTDKSCWHHYGARGCRAPNAHRTGSFHFRMKSCERTLNDPIKRAPLMEQVRHMPAVPPVIIQPVPKLILPPPVLRAPGVTTCGRPAVPPSGSRIIGGDESRAHSWPWQVALRNINARSSRCAGTLIAPQWVLTTAHCVDQDQTPAHWFVLAGAHDLLQLESSRAVHAVSRIIIHERFDLNTFDNDMALLRLTVPVQFNAHISPVCLPPHNTILAPGTQCIIAGWGVAAKGRRPLKQAAVPVIGLSTCRRPDWLGLEFTLTENMMCAGFENGGVDTCQGDSGGPLVCFVNNHWLQAGVTSFGRGCGMPKKPGVYTMVSRFVPWIQNIVNTL